MKLRAKAYLRIAATGLREALMSIGYDVGNFHEGLAWVELNGKYGFTDKTGNIVVPLKYDLVYNFSEGLAEVQLNNKWGLINKRGKEVVPPKYRLIQPFYEGLAAVYSDDERAWGFIDKTGKEVIPPKYTQPEEVEDMLDMNFENGLAKVLYYGKWIYINKQDREIPEDYITAIMLGGSLDRILEIEGSL